MTCGECVFYVTDEDGEGHLTSFHSAEGLPEAFCAIRDLFTVRRDGDSACTDFVPINDEEDA